MLFILRQHFWDDFMLRSRVKNVYLNKSMMGEHESVRVLDRGSENKGNRWRRRSHMNWKEDEAIGQDVILVKAEEWLYDDQDFVEDIAKVLTSIAGGNADSRFTKLQNIYSARSLMLISKWILKVVLGCRKPANGILQSWFWKIDPNRTG